MVRLSLFDDVWILSLGLLHNHLLHNVATNSYLAFIDFITIECTWDVGKLFRLFPSAIISYIVGIKCPDVMDISDSCIWRHDNKVFLHSTITPNLGFEPSYLENYMVYTSSSSTSLILVACLQTMHDE
ncbi:hypothetical protein GQ457_18G005490 [Hibiscus cannabinus]